MSDHHETRKLSVEELYQDMYKRYKKGQQTIGEMQSYIDELKYENEQLKHELNQLKNEKNDSKDPQADTDLVPDQNEAPEHQA